MAGKPKILRGLLIVLRTELYGLLEADDGLLGVVDTKESDAEIIIGTWLIRRFFEGVERIDIPAALDIGDAQIVMELGRGRTGCNGLLISVDGGFVIPA